MTPMMHAIENINIDAIKLFLSIDYKDEFRFRNNRLQWKNNV